MAGGAAGAASFFAATGAVATGAAGWDFAAAGTFGTSGTDGLDAAGDVMGIFTTVCDPLWGIEERP